MGASLHTPLLVCLLCVGGGEQPAQPPLPLPAPPSPSWTPVWHVCKNRGCGQSVLGKPCAAQAGECFSGFGASLRLALTAHSPLILVMLLQGLHYPFP